MNGQRKLLTSRIFTPKCELPLIFTTNNKRFGKLDKNEITT